MLNTTHGQARLARQLTTRSDWERLLNGDVDAIHLQRFAIATECAELLEFLNSHCRTQAYGTAAGIHRLGTSFSDARRGETLGEYHTADVLAETLAINGGVARLVGQITASWPLGVETLVYEGIALHRAILRRLAGGGAEPHDDNIAKELPQDRTAATVTVQLGVNLYIEMPETGGSLEGWRIALGREQYESTRNPAPGLQYGVRREAIGPSDWELCPRVGDVVIFRNSEIHAIQKSVGHRSSLGFFLGYRDHTRPLLMWS